MKTGVFRGGCLTARPHSSAELHGFLAYFFKGLGQAALHCVRLQGQQVRTKSTATTWSEPWKEFILAPRPGEVYNLGEQGEQRVILECMIASSSSLQEAQRTYSETNRIATTSATTLTLRKLKAHYPNWRSRAASQYLRGIRARYA